MIKFSVRIFCGEEALKQINDSNFFEEKRKICEKYQCEIRISLKHELRDYSILVIFMGPVEKVDHDYGILEEVQKLAEKYVIDPDDDGF